MSSSPKDGDPLELRHNKDSEATIIGISKDDLSTLDNEPNHEKQSTATEIVYHISISVSDESNADKCESYPLSFRASNNIEINDDSSSSTEVRHLDSLQLFRKGTDDFILRHVTEHMLSPDTNIIPLNRMTTERTLNRVSTTQEKWEEFILHLRHAASYRAEFDIYQVLAYRAMVSYGQKIYFKPFKALKGIINDKWSNLQVRWLNSFQRVLCQAFICFCIQTIGVTVILTTQFTSYFADHSEHAQCDSSIEHWKAEWHLKLLAFLWTAFIALGVSGWVYKARHSGFYAILIFLKRNQYPNFVSSTILQIGLLSNYYVVTCSVIGSFILIYQTEGGTSSIGMILQAVALFFILELDNRMVHSRDFLSIYKYMDLYIKNGKHKKMPHCVVEEDLNCCNKPIDKCRGSTCLSGILSIASFALLVIMTVCGFVAPWLIMVCW